MVTLLDTVNGTFEIIGGIATWGNVRRIMRDKKVEGVDWRATFFFTLWGFWNTILYTKLHLVWSFIGGLVIASANLTWVIFALKYRASTVPLSHVSAPPAEGCPVVPMVKPESSAE